MKDAMQIWGGGGILVLFETIKSVSKQPFLSGGVFCRGIGKSNFVVVLLFIGSFQYYKNNFKEKTSNVYSASYSIGSCPLAII